VEFVIIPPPSFVNVRYKDAPYFSLIQAIGRSVCSSSRRLVARKWYYAETDSEMTLCTQQSGVPREITPEHPLRAGQSVILTSKKKTCPEECFRVCHMTTGYSSALCNKVHINGFMCKQLCSLSYLFSHKALVPYVFLFNAAFINSAVCLMTCP
jgi:hypothetical protein